MLGHVVQVYQSAPGPARLAHEEVERTLVAYLRWVRNAYDKARLYGLESAGRQAGSRTEAVRCIHSRVVTSPLAAGAS